MRDAVHAGAGGGTPFPGKMGIVATAIVAAVRRIEWEKGWAMARRTYHLTLCEMVDTCRISAVEHRPRAACACMYHV